MGVAGANFGSRIRAISSFAASKCAFVSRSADFGIAAVIAALNDRSSARYSGFSSPLDGARGIVMPAGSTGAAAGAAGFTFVFTVVR